MAVDSSEGGVDSFARKSIEGTERDGAILASLVDPAGCFAGRSPSVSAIAAGTS